MSNLFVLPNLSSQNRLSAVHLMGGGAFTEAAPAAGAPVEDVIANAANANNAVLAYSRGLASTKLPFVPNSPAWYTKFTEKYTQIGANAMYWQESISPRLIGIPRTIVSYGGLFELKASLLSQYLDQLILDPKNETARRMLRDTLLEMIRDIDRQQNLVTTFDKDLNGFSNTLNTDADIMSGCVRDAMKEIGQDQKKIEALQKSIADLKSELATWNKVIIGAGLGAGVSIFIGCVGLVLAAAFGPIGWLVVGLGVIGAVGGFATMIAAMVKIRQLSNEIDSTSADLGRTQQRVLALQSVQTNVETLIRLSTTAQGEIGKLITAWSLLKGGMQKVADDLGNANKKFQASQFVDMRSDITKAKSDWKDLSALAEKFTKIDIKVEESTAVIGDRKAA
ncbi:MAG TPA: HBL/NHE enterotoxin family protein [Thermoanaerobaculia bacterium]|nr:HBL/NHE enterotoxin family protein [Thermoanaerobaculia bacterium]